MSNTTRGVGRKCGWFALVLAGLLAGGCKRNPAALREQSVTEAFSLESATATPMATAGKATPANVPQNAPALPARVKAAAARPAELWKEFSGDRAFAEVLQQVEVGPRPSGSLEIEKARVLIEESLRRSGWTAERQKFADDTPRGKMQFANIIARFAGSAATAQQAIVCSHYDTKRFSTISFVGASDGASSTGALLELARVLAMDPALAAKLELVFFDGEEALEQFTLTDGLYGSRFYARNLRDAGRAAQFRFAILWDMIGDKDLTITLSTDSPKDLAREILSAADALKVRQNFGYYDRAILDDHASLNAIARIPAIDLIDFDYAAWHTADDKLDRISASSLQTVGAVTVYHLSKAFR